jgi:hypothetical protein
VQIKCDIEETNSPLVQPQSQSYTTFQKVSDWLPLVVITAGLVLDWLKLEYGGGVMIAGFFLYGVLGVITSIRKQYYRGRSIRLLKLVNDIAIIVLTVGLVTGTNTLLYLVMLILLDRLILLPKA